jgi:tellurite resistance protein
MEASDKTLLRSLIAVAWADGKVAKEERALVDSLIEAFHADEAETKELRRFASASRTLDDVALQDLDAGDRRRLLQLAVLISFVDGAQDEKEKALIDDLARRLEIPKEESEPLLEDAAMRAKGLLRSLGA